MELRGCKIPIVLGSVREARIGLRAAIMTVEAVRARGAEPFLIDPAEMPLPMLNLRFFEMPQDRRAGAAQVMSDHFREADAIIFVTAEYNHSLPPALKNIIDHFGPPEFSRKPIGIVSYSAGKFGGVRASDALRCIIGTLNGVTVGEAVSIPELQTQVSEDGKPLNPHWEERLSRLLDEIAFWIRPRPSAGPVG